jgi:hypothetical protein
MPRGLLIGLSNVAGVFCDFHSHIPVSASTGYDTFVALAPNSNSQLQTKLNFFVVVYNSAIPILKARNLECISGCLKIPRLLSHWFQCWMETQ